MSLLTYASEKIESLSTGIIDFCQLYRNVSSTESKSKTLPSVTKSYISQISTRSESISHLITSYQKRLKSESETTSSTSDLHQMEFSNLKQSVEKLAQYVTAETYFSSSYSRYNTYPYNYQNLNGNKNSSSLDENQNKWANKIGELKSDIRSLKGLMLNRRNFPAPVFGSKQMASRTNSSTNPSMNEPNVKSG